MRKAELQESGVSVHHFDFHVHAYYDECLPGIYDAPGKSFWCEFMSLFVWWEPSGEDLEEIFGRE